MSNEEAAAGTTSDKPFFGLFRKDPSLSSSKDAGQVVDASADAPPTVRKTKSFKRIRGLLGGESRKERREQRKTKENKQAAATTTTTTTTPPSAKGGTKPDDTSTVYHVDVDERSVLTSRSTPAAATTSGEAKTGDGAAEGEGKKEYLLKVVLLLMDPDTRRFELLQLEFDSLKALVSDVLAQIPLSVTEESLRLKSYTSITSRDGVDWSPDKLLSSFCKGNDILVAVPTGVPAKECARLARPILSDDKVVSMVRLYR
jgi:hypothetical protein